MIRQNRKIQFVVLIALVCLVGTMTIAYAVLSTALNISGTAQVMNASWDVHFDNIEVNPGSVEIEPKIIDDDKITFSANLTTPGDFYKFTVDIVNEGSIDAMIESVIKNPELTTEQKKYLRYEVEYIDGTSINETQLLKSGDAKTISVLVSYRNDIAVSDLPKTEINLDLEIVLVYVQATSIGTEIPDDSDKLVRVVNGDINTIGSEIAIGDECFYLIGFNDNKAMLFAKYNLYVGSECVHNPETDVVSCTPYGESATSIQNSTMVGKKLNSNIRTGTLYFSPVGYWDSYISTYPAYVYNENSTIYEHVDNYKKYLSGLGANIEDARLIKKEELEMLGCSISKSNCSSSYNWVYSTSYWTGTAQNSEGVWFVLNDSSKSFTYNRQSLKINYGQFGVRPVIEISLAYF